MASKIKQPCPLGALEYLERSARAREAVSFMAPFGLPAYDPLRQSARFAAVIRAFGADPTPFIRPLGSRIDQSR